LLRQNGRILLKLDELEKRMDELEFGEDERPAGLLAGNEAPNFELPDLAGETRTLAQYRGRAVLLIFFNPACGFCREMAPKLAKLTGAPHPLSSTRGEGRGEQANALASDSESLPRLLIITTGDLESNRQLFSEHKVPYPVLLQKDSEISTAYQASGTPTGYLLSAEGKIASKLAVGADALLTLAKSKAPGIQPHGEGEAESETDRADRFNNRSLARSKIQRNGLRAGTPAPDFTLPRLDGRGDLSLSDLRGKRALLVFSSPSCGPCDALAPRLEEFHRAHPELEIVMISKGEPKENRAKVKEFGLTFPIVLQQQWEISRRYAMFATPVAYLIDQEGIITRDVAVGSDTIQELMNRAGGVAGKSTTTAAA
jgi:peroxiredoxin